MIFNAKDYKDNIAYCKYVFENNEGLELGLKTPAEIQYVANQYVDSVNSLRGFADESVYEDDAMLVSVAQKSIRKFESIKKRFKKPTQEDRQVYEELEKIKDKQQAIIDEEIDIKLKNEKNANKRGKHSFDDGYDDFGLDEFIEEDKVIRR